MIVYGGSPDSRETYHQKRETPVDYTTGYVTFLFNWNELLRENWKDRAGYPIENPGQSWARPMSFGANMCSRNTSWLTPPLLTTN